MIRRPVRTALYPESLKLIGIPASMAEKSAEDIIVDSSAREKLKDFVLGYMKKINENFAKNVGLYFYGSNGTGKTFMSCLVLREAYRHRFTARRITFAEYCKKYTKSWGAKSADEREMYEAELYEFKSAEFLLLEEIGKGVENSTTIPILEDLLRYREDKGYPTLFATNLRIEQVRELYGASIYSLITGHCIPVKMEEKDRRGD